MKEMQGNSNNLPAASLLTFSQSLSYLNCLFWITIQQITFFESIARKDWSVKGKEWG